MKCPKCSFISFDYNDACPKCGNDLSHERDLMNFQSYRPKPLSLLGLLTGDGEIPAVNTRTGQSEGSGAPGERAKDLLISLDSLSGNDQEPILLGPQPSLTGLEAKIEMGSETADEEFAISLDDLSDEGPELVLFDPETEAAIPGMEIGVEALFEPETFLSEGAGPKKEGVTSDRAEEPTGKGKETGLDLFELELEPLELDVEMEVPDKKTP